MDSIQNQQLQAYAALYARQNLGGVTEADQKSPTEKDQDGNAVALGTPSQGYQAGTALGVGWGAYAGGVAGMAGMAGATGSGGVSAGIFSAMGTPGPYAMGAMQVGGMTYEKVDNTIEVAGTGMGGDKKYKMYAGELLAVYTIVKQKDNIQPEEMVKSLKEKFGIDAEVKTVDGKKTVINRATGNTMISDGNGNNLMDTSDMKFKEALATIKDKFNIDADQFAKMYDRTQGGSGANYGAGALMTVGYVDPYSDSSMTAGLWGDSMWQDTVRTLFSSAALYSRVYTPWLGAGDEAEVKA